MKYNPAIHRRRSIRLKDYDYSKNGLYFITICAQHRSCLFGKIENAKMIWNDAGMMVSNEWLQIPTRFHNTELHEFVVMPNHFHAILEITPPVGATLVVAQDSNPTDTPVRATLVVAQDSNPTDTPNPTLVVARDINPNDNPINNPIKQMDDGIKTIETPENDMCQNGQLYKGQPRGCAPTVSGKTVGDMVGAFKSITTGEYIHGVKNLDWPPFDGKLWQRNYHEHIIRNHE